MLAEDRFLLQLPRSFFVQPSWFRLLRPIPDSAKEETGRVSAAPKMPTAVRGERAWKGEALVAWLRQILSEVRIVTGIGIVTVYSVQLWHNAWAVKRTAEVAIQQKEFAILLLKCAIAITPLSVFPLLAFVPSILLALILLAPVGPAYPV
jgi:hypothetical protein